MLIAILLITGCTDNVHTTYMDLSVDLTQYKTYAFLPPGDKYNEGMNEMAYAELRDKTIEELTQLKYELNPENPDFLVLIHVNFGADTMVEELPASYTYYGEEFYEGLFIDDYYYPDFTVITEIDPTPGIRLVRYTYGTVVVDIIDTKTKKIVWRGWDIESDFGYDPDELIEDAKSGIDEIFDWFPKETDRG